MPGADPSERSPFSYLILRVVPSVERGERVNAGVVLFCRQRGFLGATVELSPARVGALTAGIDLAEVSEHLTALVRVAEGAAGGGPVAALPASERFGWLAAPSSTIVQPSAVHTGLCEDPVAMLAALHRRLVA